MTARKDPSHDIEASKVVALEAAFEILKDKRKLFWLNFSGGFIRGFSGVLGAAIAVVIIGYAVASLGGLPIIGDFMNQLGQGVPTTTK